MQGNIREAPKEIRKVELLYGEEYENYIEKIKQDAVNDIETLDITNLDFTDRKPPEYALGSFNEKGIPSQEKVRRLLHNIINAISWINVIEGSVRGGKDVWGLYCWSKYLMTCPAKLHLALGVSLEHAILTILHSSGFGLFYTIPNGKFERKTINGAQRGVYSFVDNYGLEKEIHFYGNLKQDDYKKYQGFTFGSAYINEANIQHLNGINEAVQRTNSSKHRVVIATQNPKGIAGHFYSTFEKDRLGTTELKDYIVNVIQPLYTEQFRDMENRITTEWKQEKQKYIKDYCEKKKAIGYKYLSEKDKLLLHDRVMKLNFGFEHRIRSVNVGFFDKSLINYEDKSIKKVDKREIDKLYNYSIKKCIEYERKFDNPNGIENFIDYYYEHFTQEDNISLTSMQRHENARQYKEGTAIHSQRILGIRRTAENTFYTCFTADNILDMDIQELDKKRYERYIIIDVGFSKTHLTGILDCDVDWDTGTGYVVQEMLLNLSGGETIQDIENYYWEMVRSRRGRKQPSMCIIDPSHTATINHFYTKGINVVPADNRTLVEDERKKKFGNLIQQRDLIGIDLVNLGFSLLRLLVNSCCVNLISQIESYEGETDENTGKTKVKKVNDDLVDPLKYFVNTVFGGTMYWEEKDGEIKDDKTRVREDESGQNTQGNLDRYRDIYEELYKSQREIENNSTGGYGEEWDTNYIVNKYLS